jgi:benzoyl-CoA reductase subunit C
MTALQELTVLPARKDNSHVGQWKAGGGRVVGYVCNYVPEEIIHGAGLLPYRMEARGINETGLADIYMHRFNCTYARSLLQAGLSGEYDFLDGFCLLNGCEQIRRLYEIWNKHLPTDHLFMVTVPHSLSDAGFEWYQEELDNFRQSLAHTFGVRCSDHDLHAAIGLYNESRLLIDELYELRKAEQVPIRGFEVMRILLAAGTMTRKKFNDLLKQAMEEIRSRPGTTDYRARLMVGGSAMDDPGLLDLVEDLGGMVVTDSLCFGSRHFASLVEEDGDPLGAIARRYYYRSPCPRMLGAFPNRLKYTLDLALGASVDGVLLQKIVFCDNHAVDSVMLAEELEAEGIPVLLLEREYALSDIGRLKTRIQAFLERIARR